MRRLTAIKLCTGSNFLMAAAPCHDPFAMLSLKSARTLVRVVL